MGHSTAQFFPARWGPGKGQTWSNVIEFQLQIHFLDFLNQTLYIFSQMNDI